MAPSYIVYRNIQAGQPANLAAPLAFFPPLGSDELFDALRAKYPHLKTHSERVGQASLEFFYEEDVTEQASFPTPQTSQSTTVSPWQPSLRSFCSEASTWSSPDGLGPATPSSSPQTLPLSRQQSRTATNSFAATSGKSSPPELQTMTSVFSLANAVQPKQRIRRKMTENEKAEYRKRRIVKACDKCAKRKRKCNHNSDELDRVSPPAKSHIAAQSTTSYSKHPHVPPQSIGQQNECPPSGSFIEFDESSGTDPISSFDDFDDQFLPDASTDFNIDDFLAPEQPQWLWSDTPDWTLLDPVANTTMHGSGFGLGDQYVQSQDVALFDELDTISDLNSSQSLHIIGNSSPIDDTSATQQSHQQDAHAASPRQQFREGTGGGDGSFVDPSLLSDDRVHRMLRARDNERHPEDFEYPIPQHSLRAIGSMELPGRKRKTHEGAAADGRTNSSAPSLTELQPTSSSQIARGGLSNNGLGPQSDWRTHPPSLSEQSLRAHAARKMKRSEPDQQQESAARFALEGLQGRRLLESDVPDQQPGRDRRHTSSNVGLGMNKAPGSSNGMLEQTGVKQKKQSLSLGEGLTSTIDPGLQLFMVKRRLTAMTGSTPARLGTNSTEASTLRLQTIPRPHGNAERPLPGGEVHGLGESQLLVLQSTTSSNTMDFASTNGDVVTHTRPHPANAATSERDISHAGLSMFGVCEERLSDHFRRRDHFGRNSTFISQACKVIAGVGCFLVLLAYLSVPVRSLSMVLLALAAPVPDASSGTAAANESFERFSAPRFLETSLAYLRSRTVKASSNSAFLWNVCGAPWATVRRTVVLRD